jgi:hypothetical protein
MPNITYVIDFIHFNLLSVLLQITVLSFSVQGRCSDGFIWSVKLDGTSSGMNRASKLIDSAPKLVLAISDSTPSGTMLVARKAKVNAENEYEMPIFELSHGRYTILG